MKKIILMACITTLALSYTITSQAKIYKWTDSKGIVHYSATPPRIKKESKQKVKDIESKIRFAAGKSQSNQGTAKARKTDNEQQAIEKENSDSDLSGPDEKLVEYCKSQKRNLANLKNNFRNIWVDKNGKKTKLNQEQRQSKINYLKERIEEDCQEVKT